MVVISFWHVFKPCVEDFFLLVHVSVLFCILRERARGGAQFSTTFYTLYILQSFFDILLVLTVWTHTPSSIIFPPNYALVRHLH